MTCFRRKGNSFVHTAPRIRSAVSWIHTRFPCSAEQECVSIYVSGSRICHKVSRVYREPPNGGGFRFPNAASFPKKRHRGNLTAGRGISGSPINGLCKGDHTNHVIRTHSACFFLASCWSRLWFASTFFSAFRCLYTSFCLSTSFWILAKVFF